MMMAEIIQLYPCAPMAEVSPPKCSTLSELGYTYELAVHLVEHITDYLDDDGDDVLIDWEDARDLCAITRCLLAQSMERV